MSFFTGLLQLAGLAPAPLPHPPDPIGGTWLGIDAQYIPGAPKSPPDLTWMGLLGEHSNLRFCGAYLEGGPATYPAGWQNYPNNSKSGTPFTSASTQTSRAWIPNVTALRGQGWGTAFFYVGYSVGGGQPIANSNATDAQYAGLGTLHAQHAKLIMATVDPALDGAVVYLDNEDHHDQLPGLTGGAIMQYYAAFLAELQQPGPGAGVPALRPGLYAAPGGPGSPVVSAFLTQRSDLYWWVAQYETQNNAANPGGLNTDPVHLDPSRPGRRLPTARAPGADPLVWAVGHQFREYTGSLPDDGQNPSPAAQAMHTTGTPTGAYSWFDYSSSLVRDPAYPVGEPRLACGLGNSAAPAVAEGFFAPADPGGMGAPPQMAVDLVTPAARQAVTLADGQYLEPETPLSAASIAGAGATTNYFAGLLSSGDLAVFDDGALQWASTGSFSAAGVRARRLRALALAVSAADELELFFVGYDSAADGTFALYGMQLSDGDWSAPAAIGNQLSVHPFASLAATVRAGTSVEVFTVSWTDGAPGVLTRAWWAIGDTWPPASSEPLETAGPSAFLPGTALAAASPDPATVVVFGVGADYLLRYVQVDAAGTPGAVTVMGAATDFVAPHTALTAVPSTAGVTVAAFADTGRVRIYDLATSGAAWSVTTTLVDDPPQVPAAGPADATAMTATANQWRLNPFGDLAIGYQGTTQYLYAAGTNPSYANPKTNTTAERTALLQCQLPGGPWQVFQR
jgi:hypothetical protein